MGAKVHTIERYSAHCSKCGWIHITRLGLGWKTYHDLDEAQRAVESHKCLPEQVKIQAKRKDLMESEIEADEMIKQLHELDRAWQDAAQSNVGGDSV